MYLKAVYTVEAAILVPILLVILMGVFQASGDLYRESRELTEVLEQREIETVPVKGVRSSYFIKQLFFGS